MAAHGAFLAALAFSVALPAGADEVAIPPSRDASMFEDSENGCGDGPLFAGQTGSFGIRRALMHFDVAAAVPAGSTIQSAALDFYVDKSGPFSMEADVFALHRLVSDWGEGATLCVLGDGFPAEPDDATWSYSFFDSVSWTNPGGDFSSTASVSIAMPLLGEATFPSTTAAVADVQSWLDTPSTNYGWILRGEESLARTARRILSREEQDELHSGPVLRIGFTPPVLTPPAVPDGQTGSPLGIDKLSPAGTDLRLTWDATSCSGATDHHVLYGTRSGFPPTLGGGYVLQGSVCNLGAASPYTWTGSPDPAVLDPVHRLLFILVVADDDATTEGSWGHASQSLERNGAGANGASNQCGVVNKDLSNACGNR